MEPSPASPPRPAATSAADRLRDWLRWVGVARVVAVGVSVLCVGLGGYWLLRTPPPPVESALPRASSDAPTASTGASPPAAASTTSVPGEVVVHVAGAVAAPGVYSLPVGARVVDALAVAGGARADADVDVLNEASPLRDGERVFVPVVGQAVPAVATGAASPPSGDGDPVGPIDVNTASAEQLDALPGVGPATAAAIVAHRDEHGPFASVDDLADVRGIGPAKLDALRDLVAV